MTTTTTTTDTVLQIKSFINQADIEMRQLESAIEDTLDAIAQRTQSLTDDLETNRFDGSRGLAEFVKDLDVFNERRKQLRERVLILCDLLKTTETS